MRAVGQWWVRCAVGETEEVRVEAPVAMVMAVVIFSKKQVEENPERWSSVLERNEGLSKGDVLMRGSRWR